MDDVSKNQNPATPAQSVPVEPVSTFQKERDVSGAIQVDSLAKAESNLSEVIQASEKTVELSQEEKEAGVKAVSQTPVLTDDHHEAGIYQAKESVPVRSEPTGAVALPMTQAQARSVLKLHKKISDSIVWLAAIIMKYFKSNPEPI